MRPGGAHDSETCLILAGQSLLISYHRPLILAVRKADRLAKRPSFILAVGVRMFALVKYVVSGFQMGRFAVYYFMKTPTGENTNKRSIKRLILQNLDISLYVEFYNNKMIRYSFKRLVS